MSSVRYIPSSYCHGVLKNDRVLVPRLDITEEQEPASPTAMAHTAMPPTPVKRAPPPVPAVEPEPVFSTYAQGTILPAAYYYQSRPNERKMTAPLHLPSETLYDEAATPKAHVHDDETCPYRQHFTPQKPTSTPVRRVAVNAIETKAGANDGFSYEPSSYAFARSDDPYTLSAKKSVYSVAPTKDIDEGMPSATPTGEYNSTMDTTQLASAQINGRQTDRLVQAVTPPQSRGVRFASSQLQPNPQPESYPKTPISRNVRAAMSTYVGGVPNDLVAAYNTSNMPSMYQQQSYQRNQIDSGPSDYHYNQQEPAQMHSTVTADLQESEAIARAARLNQNQGKGLNDMSSIGKALNGIGRQIPGHAFAPLNVPACSEYQFDQLQDLTSCI